MPNLTNSVTPSMMTTTLALVSSYVVSIVIKLRVTVHTMCTIEFYKYSNTIDTNPLLQLKLPILNPCLSFKKKTAKTISL